ncbi:MAG TPA: hypothetical protein VFU76_04435 [Terriglobales bacterium]|nr:hypothetical protein [Terriglobales bacterium]
MALADLLQQRLRGAYWRDPVAWLEIYCLANLTFLAVDILIAHSVNDFRRPQEYIPLLFSVATPFLLLPAILAWLRFHNIFWWKALGYVVGWTAVIIGITGVIFHLDSRFFYERTLKSLVYAAPFVAPLAYTGLGLLLILNRMLDARSDNHPSAARMQEWARWVIFLAMAGLFGNFVLSLADHSDNAFFNPVEWIAVISSAFTFTTVLMIFVMPVTRRYLRFCAAVLGIDAAVGVLGFVLHTRANLEGPSTFLNNIRYVTPPIAPLLFPTLVSLTLIGIWVLAPFLPESVSPRKRRTAAPAE